MKANRSSFLFVTLSLVILLVASIAIAGCTDTGSKTAAASVATPAATSAAAAPSQAPATAAPTAAPTTAAPAATAAPASTAQKQTILVSGSTTVLPIAQKAAEQYMATHPEADIQVSGGGSGVGVQAISAKTVDIGMSSRDLTKDELKKTPSLVVYTVAQDGIAVIVNPANTIPYITVDQLKGIYTGKITKWTEISGAGVPGTNNQIVVVGRDSASGTRTYFDETVLNKGTPTSKMLEKNSNGAVTQTVAQTPGAIGYVSIGFLSNDVKAVPIWFNAQKIVQPSLDTVKDRSYPLSRNLYVITNGNASGLSDAYIKYILSPDGQKIVTSEGYVALS